MQNTILSAGIDIGTSTTQLIFSRLSIANTGGFGSVPKIEIIGKEIIYRSEIYFTPLRSNGTIDGERVARLIFKEYEQAKIRPEDLTTGAVIITGETARKRNSKEVLHHLSELAGDFVVAAAGPDLESVLAGKGAGAAVLSKETGKLVANLDVGGGTTNICFFQEGEVLDTACLNLGGRLIGIEDGKVVYCSDTLRPILENLEIQLAEGQAVAEKDLLLITAKMVTIMEEAIGFSDYECEKQPTLLQECVTNHGITCGKKPELITFSGGVADCIWPGKETYQYGDIGVLLGRAIGASKELCGERFVKAQETLNATVVGAGNFSMEVSGSTIAYEGCQFPMKNVPVFQAKLEQEEDIVTFGESIGQSMRRFYDSEIENQHAAITFEGLPCPSFLQIEAIANQIVSALKQEINRKEFPILIVKTDIGKVLGQAIRRRMGQNISFLCLDGIVCSDGDFVDIGSPVASGKVIPVVVKTLIFDHE